MLCSAVRVEEAAGTDARLLWAQQLPDWLQGRGERDTDFRDVLRLGPRALRAKAKANEALAILKAHGWITKLSARPRRIRLLGVEKRP
jgi:hypothetical protein